MAEPQLIIVMGVSGCGKSTLASELATELGYTFVEADDFHSTENRLHMASGKALTDAMREPWIKSLLKHLCKAASNSENCVLSFSGLRASHRAKIRTSPMCVTTFHLQGSADLIRQRINARSGHFMPADLLRSQFAALEDPQGEDNTFSLDIRKSIPDLINSVKSILNTN